MSTVRRAAPANLVLAVLFTGAFVMGCAEMLVVGLIDLIATDLQVSVAAAGTLVTANALGLAVGGPVLTLLTTRFDRRTVLLAATTVFVLANLLPAFGGDYPLLVAARVLMGAVQGLFIAAGIVTATSVVPPERAGRAMAVVITGFAMASAAGLPLGTLLGQAVGWRGAFVAVVAVAALVLVAAVLVLPSLPTTPGSRALAQARAAFAPRVLAVLGLALLIFAGLQSALTYLVPFLAEVSGVSGPAVSAYLLAYGVATTAGSYAGGRFADANAARALIVGSIGVAAALVGMRLLAPTRSASRSRSSAWARSPWAWRRPSSTGSSPLPAPGLRWPPRSPPPRSTPASPSAPWPAARRSPPAGSPPPSRPAR